MKKLAILNTSIMTTEGTYSLHTIPLDEARELAASNEILSAVGHQSTAEILTELLGVDVPMNRIQFAQEPGQQALVFKLNGRPPEGRVFSRDEIDEIGYAFQLMTREDEEIEPTCRNCGWAIADTCSYPHPGCSFVKRV